MDVRLTDLKVILWVDSLAAKALDCKSSTPGTSLVQVQLCPPIFLNFIIFIDFY